MKIKKNLIMFISIFVFIFLIIYLIYLYKKNNIDHFVTDICHGIQIFSQKNIDGKPTLIQVDPKSNMDDIKKLTGGDINIKVESLHVPSQCVAVVAEKDQDYGQRRIVCPGIYNNNPASFNVEKVWALPINTWKSKCDPNRELDGDGSIYDPPQYSARSIIINPP